MEIQKELQPIALKIEEVAAKANGMNIGTSLQDFLQTEMTKVLPTTIGYQFDFNLSGWTEHTFYEIENPNNAWTG